MSSGAMRPERFASLRTRLKDDMKVLFFILVTVSVILGVYQVHVISSIPGDLGTEVKEVVPERMSDVHPSGKYSGGASAAEHGSGTLTGFLFRADHQKKIGSFG